ncbi:hypothetical protein [Pontixanthobacter aquaemixtae]|uniref:Uncharacterized protein n=1 Tax=Pontixanthobacter aquaemixtae TaxID=1958940 RepID=A0A844ZU02_9SPHN|nr:hypothetical protein [Pontixanthobacter aquaemixtae]MXO90600.1 hypothetical protein [Pontixanthobacter aquaemixtae]
MTVYFAAARTPAKSPLARAFQRRELPTAANDNPGGIDSDHLLHSALRHFAKHGLRAAEEARKEAEKSFFAGDRESYQWWLGICRTLDRRMAAQIQSGKSLG